MNMLIETMDAGVETDQDGRPVALITLTVSGGREIQVMLRQSRAYSDTLNMEIDGDLVDDDPSLRIHLNDFLIHDSTRNDPPVESPRRPDLPLP